MEDVDGDGMMLRTSVTGGGNWMVLIEINDSFIESHSMIITPPPSPQLNKVEPTVLSDENRNIFNRSSD